MGLKEIHGLEHSSTMIEDSKVFLKNFDGKEGIKIVQGRAQELPFEDNAFDLIYTHVCLTHIPPKDIPKVTQEIARVSKKFIVHVERFAYPYEHPNPHRWSHMLAPFYLDMGFEVVENDIIHKEYCTNILVLKT